MGSIYSFLVLLLRSCQAWPAAVFVTLDLDLNQNPKVWSKWAFTHKSIRSWSNFSMALHVFNERHSRLRLGLSGKTFPVQFRKAHKFQGFQTNYVSWGREFGCCPDVWVYQDTMSVSLTCLPKNYNQDEQILVIRDAGMTFLQCLGRHSVATCLSSLPLRPHSSWERRGNAFFDASKCVIVNHTPPTTNMEPTNRPALGSQDWTYRNTWNTTYDWHSNFEAKPNHSHMAICHFWMFFPSML